MSFFDDDPFDSILKEFFESSRVRNQKKDKFIKGEDEDRNIDFIEDGKFIYLVFELPGFEEKDFSVTVNSGDLIINAKKVEEDSVQDYLYQKLRKGISIRKKIPEKVNSKDFSYHVRNGVLEIVFHKSGGRR